MKKYQKGGVPSPMKSNPKTITPYDDRKKQKSILEEPKEPVKPTPPSYRMKKGGSVSKSKKK
jgi:hypothetical protein